MIYLMETEGQTTHRMVSKSNQPLDIKDFSDFPMFKEDGVEVGIVSAYGGNILFVPVLEEYESEKVMAVNVPATSHYECADEYPILSPIALLVTEVSDLTKELRKLLKKPIEDGFISPLWRVRKYAFKQHDDDCVLNGSHAGLTYVMTGKDAGTYVVEVVERGTAIKKEVTN